MDSWPESPARSRCGRAPRTTNSRRGRQRSCAVAARSAGAHLALALPAGASAFASCMTRSEEAADPEIASPPTIDADARADQRRPDQGAGHRAEADVRAQPGVGELLERGTI